MAARNYLCTRNNPDGDTRAYLEAIYEKLKATYVCG